MLVTCQICGTTIFASSAAVAAGSLEVPCGSCGAVLVLGSDGSVRVPGGGGVGLQSAGRHGSGRSDNLLRAVLEAAAEDVERDPAAEGPCPFPSAVSAKPDSTQTDPADPEADSKDSAPWQQTDDPAGTDEPSSTSSAPTPRPDDVLETVELPGAHEARGGPEQAVEAIPRGALEHDSAVTDPSSVESSQPGVAAAPAAPTEDESRGEGQPTAPADAGGRPEESLSIPIPPPPAAHTLEPQNPGNATEASSWGPANLIEMGDPPHGHTPTMEGPFPQRSETLGFDIQGESEGRAPEGEDADGHDGAAPERGPHETSLPIELDGMGWEDSPEPEVTAVIRARAVTGGGSGWWLPAGRTATALALLVAVASGAWAGWKLLSVAPAGQLAPDVGHPAEPGVDAPRHGVSSEPPSDEAPAEQQSSRSDTETSGTRQMPSAAADSAPAARGPARAERPARPASAASARRQRPSARRRRSRDGRRNALRRGGAEARRADAASRAAPRQSAMDVALEHYRQGNLHIQDKQISLAVQELKKCLGVKPDFGLAYRSLGVAYMLLGWEKDAIEAYEEFLRLVPDHRDAARVKSIITRFRERRE